MSAEEVADSVLNTVTEGILNEYPSIFDTVTTGWTLEDFLTLVSEVQISYTAFEPKEIDWEVIAEYVRNRKVQLLQISPAYSKKSITSEQTTAKECKDTYEQLMTAFDEPFQKACKQLKNQKVPTAVTKRNLLFRRLLWERAQKAISNRKRIFESLCETKRAIINLESGYIDDTSPKGSDSESEVSDDMDEENEDGLPLEERTTFIAQLARALCIDEGFSRIPVGGSMIIELPVVSRMEEGEEGSNGNLQCQITTDYKDLPPSDSSMVSPQLTNLVTTAISEAGEEDRTVSVASAISPTLSMLLEMPPRDRGQPLPRIASLMNVHTGAVNHGTTVHQVSPVPPKETEGSIECPSKSPEKKNDSEPRNEMRGAGGVPVLPLQTQEEIEIANDFVIESGLVPQTVESTEIDTNGALVYTGSDEINSVEVAKPILMSLEKTSSDKMETLSKCNLAQTLVHESIDVEPSKAESIAEGEKISIVKTVCSVVSEVNEAAAEVAILEGDKVVQSDAPTVSAEIIPPAANLDAVVQDAAVVPAVLSECQTDELVMGATERTDKRTDESVIKHPDHPKGSAVKSPRKSAGEKVDSVSAPLTRNSAKDRQIKPVEITKKVNKDVVSLTSVKRTRSAAVDDSKAEQKSTVESPQKNSVSFNRKSSSKQPPPPELHTPLRKVYGDVECKEESATRSSADDDSKAEQKSTVESPQKNSVSVNRKSSSKQPPPPELHTPALRKLHGDIDGKEDSVKRSIAANDSKAEPKSMDEIPQKNSLSMHRKSSSKQAPPESHTPALRKLHGDIEFKEESVHGKRITRARAKTSTSPGAKPKVFYSKRESQVDNEVSSETERGPSRATRSRASVGVTLSSSAVESLPTALSAESNPSSPTSSVANSITLDDEKDHRVFRKSIMLLYNELMNHKHSHLFLKSASDEDVKDYSKIVKFPMDLTTIKKNIELGVCRTYASFERDVYLMFMNAMMFNSEDHQISLAARAMERDVDKMFKAYKNSHQDPTVKAAKDEPPLVKYLEVDGPLETDEDRKSRTTRAKETRGRKRRNLSLTSVNAEETETKKRTLRTSTTAATIAASAWQGSRKAKNQVSPDIVSSSKAD